MAANSYQYMVDGGCEMPTSNKSMYTALRLSQLNSVLIGHVYLGCDLCRTEGGGGKTANALSEHRKHRAVYTTLFQWRRGGHHSRGPLSRLGKSFAIGEIYDLPMTPSLRLWLKVVAQTRAR